MKLTALRHTAAATIATAFLAAGVVTATPASAAGDYSCGNWKETPHSWSASCTVRSGQARSITECSNGKTLYGKWVGRGSWRFGGECGKYWVVSQDTRGRD